LNLDLEVWWSLPGEKVVVAQTGMYGEKVVVAQTGLVRVKVVVAQSVVSNSSTIVRVWHR